MRSIDTDLILLLVLKKAKKTSVIIQDTHPGISPSHCNAQAVLIKTYCPSLCLWCDNGSNDSWPVGNIFFSCSTQLSTKFFLLLNVKMPTIVGILTFMTRTNSILGLSEPEKY